MQAEEAGIGARMTQTESTDYFDDGTEPSDEEMMEVLNRLTRTRS